LLVRRLFAVPSELRVDSRRARVRELAMGFDWWAWLLIGNGRRDDRLSGQSNRSAIVWLIRQLSRNSAFSLGNLEILSNSNTICIESGDKMLVKFEVYFI
jgi:hypothetical protein